MATNIEQAELAKAKDKDDDEKKQVEEQAKADDAEANQPDAEQAELVEAQAAEAADPDDTKTDPDGKEKDGKALAEEANLEKPKAPAEKKPGDEETPPNRMIPKARFDEVNRALQSTRDELAYAKGQFEASKAEDPDGENKADLIEAVSGLDQRIVAAREKAKAAAVSYDNGESNMAEFEAIRAETDDEIAAVRTEMIETGIAERMPRQQQAFADTKLINDSSLELESNHPAVHYLTDADADTLTGIAKELATREGNPYGVGPGETIRLREAVANLADDYVPLWYPDADLGEKGASSPGGKKPEATQQLNPEQQNRLDKLKAQGDDPPDTRSMGRSTGTGDAITEAEIEAMTDDEIASLPPETRARFKE